MIQIADMTPAQIIDAGDYNLAEMFNRQQGLDFNEAWEAAAEAIAEAEKALA